MPIYNKIVRSVAPKSVFPDARDLVDSTVSYNQGDLLIYDSTNYLTIKPSAEADGEFFLGIAEQSVVLGKPLSPYQGTAVDASQALPQIAGPKYGVVAKLVSKTSDAWNPGDLAYLDPATGTRGVTSSGTKAIGIYQGPAIASASAGQEIEVLIGARYPGDTLQF